MIDTQEQQELGRAMNALQDFLIRKLLIPKVYLNAEWNGTRVDVMAIDRAGSGDVHAIRMFLADYSNEKYLWKLRSFVNEFKSDQSSIQSHYRYIAVVNDRSDMRTISPEESTIRDSFASDGVGRVGILYVDLCEVDPKLQVRVILRAERFRSSKEIVELADQFMEGNTPNWEMRE
jgi:hypothetical protein